MNKNDDKDGTYFAKINTENVDETIRCKVCCGTKYVE